MFQVTKTGEQSFNAHEEFCGCHPAGAFHPSFPISFFKHSALHSGAAAAVLGCFSPSAFFVTLKSLHSRRKMAKIQIPRNDNALPLRCVKIHSLSNTRDSFLHYLWKDPHSSVRYCLNHKLWIFLGTSFHLTLSPDALPITEMRSLRDLVTTWRPEDGGQRTPMKFVYTCLQNYTASNAKRPGIFKRTATVQLSTQCSVTFADNA